jgi:hypothetical protein
VTGVEWDVLVQRYKQYTTVKCGCTTSMGTACRRWAIGYRDGATPVCQAHLSPNSTPTLPAAAIERRRVTAANQRTIRYAASVTERVTDIAQFINHIQDTITPNTPRDQVRLAYSQIGVLIQRIETIRDEARARLTPTAPVTAQIDPNDTSDLIEADCPTEDDCPICLETYTLTRRAPCGHHVCSGCCLSMKDAGRTIVCPLCRDKRFRQLVNHAVLTAIVTI